MFKCYRFWTNQARSEIFKVTFGYIVLQPGLDPGFAKRGGWVSKLRENWLIWPHSRLNLHDLVVKRGGGAKSAHTWVRPCFNSLLFLMNPYPLYKHTWKRSNKYFWKKVWNCKLIYLTKDREHNFTVEARGWLSRFNVIDWLRSHNWVHFAHILLPWIQTLLS